MSRRRSRGYSLVEAIVGLTLLATLLVTVAPDLRAWRERRRLHGAIGSMGLIAAGTRAAAMATGRGRALAFAAEDDRLAWTLLEDGDGDGVRRRDLAAGDDRALRGPVWLDGLHPGVAPGRPPGVPGVSGSGSGADGVAFGRSSMLSFAPDGAASSGTLYLRSRRGARRAAALRVYGPTGRVSLWWWEADGEGWRPLP